LSANIQSSFAAAGLVPYDPERVLSKLHTQLKMPAPPDIDIEQGPWVPETYNGIKKYSVHYVVHQVR
jgi:hypothetical protein